VLCHGRLVLLQEGGYSHVSMPFATLAIVEAIFGLSTDVTDPFRMADDTLQEWQRQAADKVVATHKHFWKLS
jgi:hypothetical protein